MRRIVIVACLVAFARCQRPGSAASGDASSPSVVDAAAAPPTPEATIESLLPKELADAPPFGNDQKRAVCGKTVTGTCEILRTKSAGKDAQGRDLVVVTVRTTEPSDGGDPFEDGIETRDHWVIGSKDGVMVFRAPIASELARTDAKIDDSLEVGTNEVKLTPADVAPSSWKRSATYTFRLSPLAYVGVSAGEFNSNPEMIGSSNDALDLRDGSGEGSFFCASRRGSYFPIPALLGQRGAIDPALGLGKCAGDVDGTARHGTMVTGAADRKNGWFRVAYLGDRRSDGRGPLYVEVHDDRFTPGDRLELRVGRGASGMLCDVFKTVVKKITIDGAGAVSQPGVIDVKRVRDEPSVRTFEITFTNTTLATEWGGFAIDMIDDDGSGPPRRVSTAAIGPELGSMTQIDLAACMNGPDGPVPVPLVRTPDAPAGAAVTKTADPSSELAAVVRAWNDATNAHDGSKLGALYANDVVLYGTKVTRERAVAIKNAAFATHAADKLSDVSVTKHRATFRKQSTSKDGRSIFVDGYIDVDASMKITAEGDTTTDENLASRKESDCLAAVEALLTSTPEGRAARKITRRDVESDGPRWTVKYFSEQPGSKKEDNAFVVTDAFELDAASATLRHGGDLVPTPAAPMSKAASACK